MKFKLPKINIPKNLPKISFIQKIRGMNKKSKIAIVATIAIIAILIIMAVCTNNSKPLVCIDAGHGGSDVGAVYGNNKRFEKDDTLKVEKKVKKELKKQNIRVIMTRSTDKNVSLEDRCKIANNKKADLFVSIHRNSSEAGNGVEVWVKNSDNDKCKELANNIMDKLAETDIQSNRGVKEGTSSSSKKNYYVTRNTKMPSCLIELGFITNEKDNSLLDKNINEYAKAICDGITTTLNEKN